MGCSGRSLKQGLPNASLRQANALQTARAPVLPSTPSYTPSLHCFPYTCLPPLPTPLLYMPFANPRSHTPFAHAKADAKLICPRARAVNPSQRVSPLTAICAHMTAYVTVATDVLLLFRPSLGGGFWLMVAWHGLFGPCRCLRYRHRLAWLLLAQNKFADRLVRFMG